MRTAVVYVFPQINAKVYEPQAMRFAKQYLRFPAGETNHDLYVVCNGGGEVTKRQESLFEPLAPTFLYHNNCGRDIGAFIMAAQNVPCDLLVCLGAPTRPRMDCWLDRMVRAVEDNGPGLYGCWGFHAPAVHIRTTVFWITPQILNAYPVQIDDHRRYEFEHGGQSITRFCMSKGFPVMQVTGRGVFPVDKWHHVEQADCIFMDQHCERIGWIDDGGGW